MKSTYAYAKLKFFRDLNQEERIKVLKVFGALYDVPDEELKFHAVQQMIFHKIFDEDFK